MNRQKKRPRHNFKVSMYLIGFVVAAAFIANAWIQTSGSLKIFNADDAKLTAMLEEERFNEAKELVKESAEAFRPSYLRFIISRKTHQREAFIESSIDSFVDERVEQITSFINAKRGRIDSFTWDLIVETMEYRPDDPRLNKFREQYINQ